MTTIVAIVVVAVQATTHPIFTSGGMTKKMKAMMIVVDAVQVESRAPTESQAATKIHTPTGGSTRMKRDVGMEFSHIGWCFALIGETHIKSESNYLQQQMGQAQMTKKNIPSFNESHCFVELMGQVQFNVCKNGLLAEKLLVSTLDPT